MALAINTSQNLNEYLDTSTSSFDMSTGSAKTITVSTGKPYKNNDVLEFRPVGQKLPGGVKLTTSTYTSATGVIVTTATVFGYSDDTPVQELALATGTINTYTNPGLSLVATDAIRIARVSTAASWGTGTVTSYNSTTGELVLNITAVGTTGTFNDMVIVSNGTFNDWTVSYAQVDTINVNTDSVLTIDTNPVVPLGNIVAGDRGTILIKNTSTTNLLKVEFSQYAASATLSVSQNGKVKVEGDWIEIGTGDNSTNQAIDITSYNISYPTFVEVETGNGTGIYKKWFIVVDGVSGQGKGFVNFMPDYIWGTGDNGNVFFFNSTTKELRVGDGTNGNKIPTGAKVRMPNIYLMAQERISYATTTNNSTVTGTVLGVVDTRAYSTATNGWAGFINNETISGAGRTGKLVNIVTRASNGSNAASISPGDIIYRRYTGSTSGVETARRIAATSGGNIDIDKAQAYGVWAYGDNFQSIKVKNFGSDMSIWGLNSTGTVEMENTTFTVTAQLSAYSFYFENVKGEISFSDHITARSVLTTMPNATANATSSTVFRCSNIVKFENITIVDFGLTATRTAGIALNTVSTKDPNYKINNLRVMGGYLAVVNSFDLKFENIYHGMRPSTQVILRSTGVSASAATDEFTLGTTYGTTSEVPPTGMPVRFVSGTYPTTVPATGNGSYWFVIKTSATTFKIATSYRNALLGNNMDLTTNGGTNMQIYAEFPMNIAISILNSSNVLFNGIYNVGVGGATYLTAADQASKNVEFYNIDYDGSYDLQYITSNQGQNLVFKNAKLYETLPQVLVGGSGGANMGMLPTSTTGTQTYIENVRGSSTGLTVNYTSQWGTGYTTDSNYNFILGYLPYYNTSAGGAAANMQNVSPFMNMIDAGLNPTTGTLGISAFTPQTNLVLTGSAFLNYQGRAFTLLSGDTITVTSSFPIRGITSFQNIAPTHVTSSGANYTYEFRVKTPLGDWSSWATLDGTNLSTALSSLTGYDSDEGFLMSFRITATVNAQHWYANGRMSTNVDSNWSAPDAYYNVVGAGATDIVEARKASDDSLVARRQGSGRIDVKAGVQIYFIRKSASGITIASTVFQPVTPVLSDNGEIQLYAGNEIQIADASQLVEDVWTKDISTITTPNTAGKVLKDKLTKNQFLGLK